MAAGDILNIVGAGGFARQLLSLLDIDHATTIRFLDDEQSPATLGAFAVEPFAAAREGERFLVAVANSGIRRAIVEQCDAAGLSSTELIAATAIISPLATIGAGAIICDLTVVESFARIGLHFHANVRAFIGHDCVIGDFVTMGPGAICNGNVHIGDGAYIGAGAIVRQGTLGRPLRIGANATVGMGAVVTKDVPCGTTVAGNPARLLEPR